MVMTTPPTTGFVGPAPRGRIVALDMARALALLAMAVFHFTFDLEMFGLLPAGTMMQPFWRWFAYLTAGSFLFLVGVSLVLAHPDRVRWRGFWRRFAMIAAAALAITAVTYVAMPDAFIFFGILHCIAVASLLGLALRHLPPVALIVLGMVVIWLPQTLRLSLLDAPWFWWTGLQAVGVQSVDYLPLFPWLGPVIFGIAMGQVATRTGLWARLSRWQPPHTVLVLAWPGRHSLAVYLIHQPVLISVIWLFTGVRP